jgi:beta-1,4-N-acetylglucosaminyltransferase
MVGKLMLIASSGGHLTQLLKLRSFWSNYERVWVTFDNPDAVNALKGEEVIWAYHPTNRNLLNLCRNTLLAIKVMREIRPKLIISTGAGVALPFFFLGKAMGTKLVFLEVFDRVSYPSITGRCVEPLVDKMLVQWPTQESGYRQAEYWGATFN